MKGLDVFALIGSLRDGCAGRDVRPAGVAPTFALIEDGETVAIAYVAAIAVCNSAASVARDRRRRRRPWSLWYPETYSCSPRSASDRAHSRRRRTPCPSDRLEPSRTKPRWGLSHPRTTRHRRCRSGSPHGFMVVAPVSRS